jgi:3-hydroxyacyl-CoA dehydrogenase
MIEHTLRDGVVTLRLDSPPVNAISFAMLDELRAALRRANEDKQVRGVVITGSAEHFSAGADLAIFQEIHAGEDALRAARVFQEAFQEIEDSPQPVAAAVAGLVIGGALELAMACHLRVAARGSRFVLPEVTLGMNPGAGGTQRLPRLVGAEAALDMLLSGRPIDARQALALGLIDAVVAPDELAVSAARLLQSGAELRRTSRLAGKIADAAANRAALGKAEARAAAVRAEIIAPRKIVEAVRAGLEESFQAGLAREREVFRECMATPAAQNKIYVFCASHRTARSAASDALGPLSLRERARVRAGAAHKSGLSPFSRAAVLGMGTMGTGIAQALISAGIRVAACDENAAALEQAVQKIRSSLGNRVRQGKLTAEQAEETLARLTTSSDDQEMSDAQVVVEAVFEDVEVKRAAIARLEQLCPAETLIASNTSTISLDVLAKDMRHPERLVGMHFFHPAQRMPLVEVVRRAATPPPLLAAAIRLVKALGKTPVVVRSREGFVVSRLLVPYLKEAFWLVEEGVEPEAVDRAMVEFGLPMGPLRLIDMSGLDILIKTDAVLRAAFPRHGPPSAIALRLVEAGHLGEKTGSGVYRYEKGDHTPRANPAAAEIVAAVRRGRAGAGGRLDPQDIVRRLMLRMVVEACDVLEEGIVEQPADIDVAMVLGIGLPDFRGGVVKYAYDQGLDRVSAQLRELTERCGPRFAPGARLKLVRSLPAGEGRDR